jgi:hypothetical protein
MHSIMLDPCDDDGNGKKLLEILDLHVVRLLAPLTQCDRNRDIVQKASNTSLSAFPRDLRP